MLGKAAERIIRTSWRSVNELAQELYAIFRGDAPIISSGPVQLSPDPGVPAIQITQTPGDDTPPITVNGQPITTSGGGGTDLGDIDWPGSDPTTITDATPATPSDNPITLYGEVVAKINGDTYSVRCWAKNPDTAPPIGILPVQQRLIDPDDTIPPTTPVFVIAFPGTVGGVRTIIKAVMQTPVWLGEQP